MNRQYIGARYVPKLMGEWNPEYSYSESLLVVSYLNASYTSKKPVPVGVKPTDINYWVCTGNYNQQVEEYRQEVFEVKEEVDGLLNPEITKIIRIPSDYKTIQEAIEENTYKSGLNMNYTILIEAGHKLVQGLYVENGDYSKFEIKSEDSIVYLSDSFIGVLDPYENLAHLMVGYRAVMPKLSCVIDMGGKFNDGFYAVANCDCYVSHNCGVLNAGRYNLHVRTSTFSGVLSRWENGQIPVRIQQCSDVTLQQATIKGGTDKDYGNIRVSRLSSVHMQGAIISDGAGDGILALRSFVNAQQCVITNCGKSGVSSRIGSKIIVELANISNCVSALSCLNNGDIVGNDLVINNCGNIISCNGASKANLYGVTATNLTSQIAFVRSEESSNINLGNVNIDGSPLRETMCIPTIFNNYSNGSIITNQQSYVSGANNSGSRKFFSISNILGFERLGGEITFVFSKKVGSRMLSFDIEFMNTSTSGSGGETIRSIFNFAISGSGTVIDVQRANVIMNGMVESDVNIESDINNIYVKIQTAPTTIDNAWSLNVDSRVGGGDNLIDFVEVRR